MEPQPNSAIVTTVPNAPITINIYNGSGKDDLPLSDEIEDFALSMEVNLDKVTKDWREKPVEELTRKLEEQVSAIRSALQLNLSPDTIIEEASKAGNYLIMIVQNYGSDYSEDQR